MGVRLMLMRASTLQGGVGNVASLDRGLVDTSRRGLGGAWTASDFAQTLKTAKAGLLNWNTYVAPDCIKADRTVDNGCVQQNSAIEVAWMDALYAASPIKPAFNTSDPLGPNKYIGPTPAPRVVNPGRVTISNVTSGKQSFVVGDSYQVDITGASPNQPVTGSASQNGQSLGTSTFGSTDSSGHFSTSGVMGTGQIGNWVETWYVGGVQSGTASFSVSQGPGPSSSQSTTPPDTTQGANTIVKAPPDQPATGVQPVPAASPLDFLTDSFSIGGMSIPIWALGLVGVGVALYAGGSHR
jgi:hypothetical protein